MKQVQMILNVLLALAVIFLLYQHFASNTKPAYLGNNNVNSGIVYVNSDSLLSQYDYFQDIEKIFEGKRIEIQNMVEANERAFEKEVQNYQEKAASMSQQERAVIEEQLFNKSEKLKMRRQDAVDAFSTEESLYNDSLYFKLQNFLVSYNKQKGYNYILGHQRGGGILYASDSLEITDDLVNALNEAYAKEKK